MTNSSTSTAPDNQIPCAVPRKRSSTTGLSSASLNLLIRCIDNVLSALNNQGLGSKVIDSRTELTDLVQPVAADFSKFFDGISEGAKMFTDQKFSKSQLSTEAHSMAVDVLKGLGNAHWVAVGLLAIANVLERFDNISANDRECIDLLKDMLKLVKYLKLMRDLKVIFHKEILDDMREAVQLVLSGSILCHSFIKSNKVSKFLLTKKIRDELVYLRGKVNSMKADLQGHVQLLIMKTLIFITGRNDETDCLEMTEQCEIEQSCETEIDGAEAGNLSSELQDICNEKDGYKKLEMTLLSFFQRGKFLRKIIPTRLGRRPKFSLNLEIQVLLEEIQPSQIEFNRKELNKATKGFSQKIGEGGFGTVYRGTLSDGRPVAVKTFRIPLDNQGWMNELRVSTKLQHRNIMQLVGYCSGEHMMLVYDYMPRNLDNVIFGEDEQIIDWPTRHNIILGIIRGLTYLHSGANRGMPVGCTIVHRDIKPSNILLDVDFNAKISDFGIAKILQRSNVQHLLEISEHEDNAQHANKEISMDGGVFDTIPVTTCIYGTLGYVDPAYVNTSRLTPKSDIYSFGVLLLNIVSGKRYVHFIEDDLHVLLEEAAMLHKEDRLTELIDPRLINLDGLTNSSTILRTIKIALCCIEEESQRRPSASQVLKMLSSEEEISIPTSPDYHSSKEETRICNSTGKYSITESSVADDISSSSPVGDSFLEKILSHTLPLDLSGTDYKFSEEENWTPNFPPILSSADYNFLEEENWVPTPPIKSFVADDHYSEEKISTHGHSSEEDISIASSLLKSVIVNANSSVQKIGESDTKWLGTSRKTLTVTGVFSFVCFIWLLRMLTNVSPL